MKTRTILMKMEWWQIQENSQEIAWCWLEKQFFTSADVAMIDHGCGVSQYPQFYDEHLENYQLLPRPYLRIFAGNNGEKMIK